MLINELKDFLQSPDHSCWLRNRKVSVYVRKSTRLVDRELIKCLDLANIEVNPRYQRQGIFKKVLQTWITYNPFSAIFIENVLNQDLHAWLLNYPHILQIKNYPHSFFIMDTKNDT